jgi:hypothetical protein
MATEPEISGMRAAYALGESVAKSYRPGDMFLGAFGEADRLGYTEETDRLCRSVFIAHPARWPLPGSTRICSCANCQMACRSGTKASAGAAAAN